MTPVTTSLDERRSTGPSATTHRRRGLVLLAIGLFQVWLWVTRVINLVNDPEPRSTEFIVVHALLYGAAFAAAGVLLVIGWRMWREARDL
jgi:polyferredoxin